MCYLQVLPLSWLLVQCHMTGDPQSTKFGPGEVEQAREGANTRRQENRAGWMEVLIRPTSRDIWLGQQKNGLISKTNYIPFRFSFGTCPNQPQRPQSKRFKWAVGIFLSLCLPIFIYLLLTLESSHISDGWQGRLCQYHRLLRSPKLKLSCWYWYRRFM